MTDTFEKGLDTRRDMWGPAGAEDQIEAATGFTWPMQDLVTRYCFGEVWQRPHLSRQMRSMLTLGMLVALGKPKEIQTHVRGAIANGLGVEEIREVLVHAMIYCGVPAAVDAFRNASEVFRELGVDEGESGRAR